MDRAVGAVQDPTRRAILLDFYDHPTDERTVDQVANAAGIHRSVAFTHLERLVTLGYLAVGKRRGRFGKPANLYRLAGERIEIGYPARQFVQLAALLAASLNEFGNDGIETARRNGRQFGSRLIRKPAITVGAALQELGPFGGEYCSAGDLVEARNCIFREACPGAPEVVCELHAGVLEGALEAAGLPRRVMPLGTDSASGCRYRLVLAL